MFKSFRPHIVVVLAAAVLGLTHSAAATSNEHYPLGAEGIKAATLPPPGFYLRNYAFYYTFNTVRDASGDKLPIAADVDLFIDAPRFIYITDKKILGGYYGFDALFTYFHMDQKVQPPGAPARMKFREADFGDIFVEPITLSWHEKQWDASVGGAFFAPTGNYEGLENVPLNRAFWTGMLILGGTYYFDEQKTISASILCRYEIHSEHKYTDITPGNDFHFEWGIGKTIKGFDVGVVGYAHWQVTDDDGPGATDDKDQVFAVGPEVGGMIKQLPLLKRPLMFSARFLWEFEARDRPEGFKTVVTLTLPF